MPRDGFLSSWNGHRHQSRRPRSPRRPGAGPIRAVATRARSIRSRIASQSIRSPVTVTFQVDAMAVVPPGKIQNRVSVQGWSVCRSFGDPLGFGGNCRQVKRACWDVWGFAGRLVSDRSQGSVSGHFRRSRVYSSTPRASFAVYRVSAENPAAFGIGPHVLDHRWIGCQTIGQPLHARFQLHGNGARLRGIGSGSPGRLEVEVFPPVSIVTPRAGGFFT